MGRGTSIIKTEVVDGQTLEYWRKLSLPLITHPNSPTARKPARDPSDQGHRGSRRLLVRRSGDAAGLCLGYGYGTIADSGYDSGRY